MYFLFFSILAHQCPFKYHCEYYLEVAFFLLLLSALVSGGAQNTHILRYLSSAIARGVRAVNIWGGMAPCMQTDNLAGRSFKLKWRCLPALLKISINKHPTNSYPASSSAVFLHLDCIWESPGSFQKSPKPGLHPEQWTQITLELDPRYWHLPRWFQCVLKVTNCCYNLLKL